MAITQRYDSRGREEAAHLPKLTTEQKRQNMISALCRLERKRDELINKLASDVREISAEEMRLSRDLARLGMREIEEQVAKARGQS